MREQKLHTLNFRAENNDFEAINDFDQKTPKFKWGWKWRENSKCVYISPTPTSTISVPKVNKSKFLVFAISIDYFIVYEFRRENS